MKYRRIAPLSIFCILFAFLPATVCPSEKPGRFVTDMAGRRVPVPKNVQRVITAGGTPAVNAFILAMGKGETIRNGRPSITTGADKRWKYQFVFAPFLAGLPVISTAEASVWAPNLEAIAAIPHDLIFVDNEYTAAMMEKKGFTVISLNWKDPECVRKTITIMGEVFNLRNRARELDQYYQKNLSRVSAHIASVPAEKRPRVLYFRTRPMALVMPSTAGRLITLAGGRFGVAGPVPENGLFSMEHLIAWDPDILLVAGGPTEVEYIYKEPHYSRLKAVRNRRVFVVPVGAHPWANYTPEHAVAVLWLAKIIYPERFKNLDIIEEMKDFYGRFFGCQLTDMQAREILTQNIQ